MKRFVEGEDRRQGVLLPEFLDDYVAEDNPVRAIDVFVDELDLRGLGFEGVVAETTGRPAYHPAMMLKIVYDAGEDAYRCPAGEKLTWRYWNVEAGRKLHNYWTTKCTGCALKSKCTPAKERRVKR